MAKRKRVVAIVGMAGSGKSEVSQAFVAGGYTRIRFGDITDEEIKRRGLALNEANERTVREALRREHGMAAYAKLNMPRITTALEKTGVVLDGLYSWEEYLLLKDHYKDKLVMVAVYTSPRTRYSRLGRRRERPLNTEAAASRDRAEIENVNKGGPIAMADFTIINESTLADLRGWVGRIISELGQR
jgi:dephospho-CoA kinase